MGTYLNPGNSGFAEILQSDYVDKTGLISLINSTIGTKKKLTCISRPRRFGKSYAAQMLCAYYDKSCDSHELFAGYEISADTTYEEHLNRYHVINLDVTGFISQAKKKKKPLGDIPVQIDKAVQAGEDVESIKNDIVLNSEDEKEEEQAKEYAAQKLKESLLNTKYTSKIQL